MRVRRCDRPHDLRQRLHDRGPRRRTRQAKRPLLRDVRGDRLQVTLRRRAPDGQTTPALEEKRCIIDVVAIRDAMAKGRLLWVPTHSQLADGLTKLDRALKAQLTAMMENTMVCLRDCEA